MLAKCPVDLSITHVLKQNESAAIVNTAIMVVATRAAGGVCTDPSMSIDRLVFENRDRKVVKRSTKMDNGNDDAYIVYW